MAKTFEYLLSLHPDKTGKEIMEIHKQELEQDKLNLLAENAAFVAFCKEVEKVKYFQHKAGSSQKYIFRVNSVDIDEDLQKASFHYDKILVHSTLQGEMTVSVTLANYSSDISKFYFERMTKVNRDVWNNIMKYIRATRDFWGEIKD